MKETDCEVTKDLVKHLTLYLTGFNKDIFPNSYNKLWKEIEYF